MNNIIYYYKVIITKTSFKISLQQLLKIKHIRISKHKITNIKETQDKKLI